jgi:hypothetical protein
MSNADGGEQIHVHWEDVVAFQDGEAAAEIPVSRILDFEAENYSAPDYEARIQAEFGITPLQYLIRLAAAIDTWEAREYAPRLVAALRMRRELGLGRRPAERAMRHAKGGRR